MFFFSFFFLEPRKGGEEKAIAHLSLFLFYAFLPGLVFSLARRWCVLCEKSGVRSRFLHSLPSLWLFFFVAAIYFYHGVFARGQYICSIIIQYIEYI